VKLLIQVLVDVSKSIHSLILFFEIVFEVLVVLLEALLLSLGFLELYLKNSVFVFYLFDGFLQLKNFFTFLVFDLFACCQFFRLYLFIFHSEPLNLLSMLNVFSQALPQLVLVVFKRSLCRRWH